MDTQQDAEIRLARAYQRVFTGSPSQEDRQLVLVDLADFTGYYRVTPPECDAATLRFNEGMRCAFGRVFRYLRMSPDEIVSLETAARETAALRASLAQNQQ